MHSDEQGDSAEGNLGVGRRRTRPSHGAGLSRAWQALIIVLVAVPAAVFGVYLGLGRSSDSSADLPLLTIIATGPVASLTAAPTPPSGSPASAAPPATTAPRSPRPAAAATASPPATLASPNTQQPFTPIAIQAEAPQNILAGADAVDCATCEGGARVRYIAGRNSLTVVADVPVQGLRTVTVVYEVAGSRMLKVSISGNAAISLAVTGASWHDPLSVSFKAEIPAGQVSIRFYNDESGGAPDLDMVTIS